MDTLLIILRTLILAALGYTLGAALARCTAHAGEPLQVPLQVQVHKRLVVAVIDTGYSGPSAQLCAPAPADDDSSKHGTNVISIIQDVAGPSTAYCVQVYKVYTKGVFDPMAYWAALEGAKMADIVNISLTGTYYEQEVPILKRLLDNGKTLVIAAGNAGLDLGVNCVAYPACTDPRVVVVGNSGSKTSNYGTPVDVSVNGMHVTAGGVTMSGTSQSAALVTGSLVKRYLESKEQ